MCKIITSTDVRKMSHSNLYHVSRTVTYGACLINNITELLFFELRKSTSYTRSIAKKLRSMLDWFSLKHADWKNYRVSSLHYFLANIFYCLGTFVKGVGPGGWSGSSKWLRLVRNWKTIDISNDLRAKPNCSLAMK